MASYVDIVNLAASKIGEDDQLRARDDDTHLGRTVAAVWNMVRQATLRDHRWNFATRRAQLAASATIVPVLYLNAFPLPADCLSFVDLLGCAPDLDFQLEGRAILSNEPGPLLIRYITDVTDTALWDTLFAEAMAARLAYQISDRITGDEGRKGTAWKDYTAALSAAKRIDAIENPPIVEEPSGWELARIGYGERVRAPWPTSWTDYSGDLGV